MIALVGRLRASVRHRLWWWRLRFPGSMYRAWRFARGARRVPTVQFEGTSGSIEAPGLSIQWGGACPVQGEGTLDGRPIYYRSRGDGWQFHVAPEGIDDVFDDRAWVHQEYPYAFPDGGWVASSVSEACIRRAVGIYRAQQGAAR